MACLASDRSLNTFTEYANRASMMNAHTPIPAFFKRRLWSWMCSFLSSFNLRSSASSSRFCCLAFRRSRSSAPSNAALAVSPVAMAEASTSPLSKASLCGAAFVLQSSIQSRINCLPSIQTSEQVANCWRTPPLTQRQRAVTSVLEQGGHGPKWHLTAHMWGQPSSDLWQGMLQRRKGFSLAESSGAAELELTDQERTSQQAYVRIDWPQ